MNCFVGCGRLTRDPEIRYTAGGKTVANIGLAINGFRDDDTLFIDCTAWERTAEIAEEYLKKGSEVVVQGPLKLNSWTDGEGNKRTKIELTINQLRMVGSRATASDEAEESKPKPKAKGKPKAKPEPEGDDSYLDDEVPF